MSPSPPRSASWSTASSSPSCSPCTTTPTWRGRRRQKQQVARWFRGEYATKREAKEELGVNILITDDDWYEYLKLFAVFFRLAGYAGMMIFIDELVNLYKIPNAITRQYNYEKLLTMYNDTLQGKARYLGIVMGATPQAIEDKRRGVYSYEALRSRLAEGKFSRPGARDLLAPVIRLEPLTPEEMLVLCEKLCAMHAGLYGYQRSLSTAGAGGLHQAGVRPHRRGPEHHPPRGHPGLYRAFGPALPEPLPHLGGAAGVRGVHLRQKPEAVSDETDAELRGVYPMNVFERYAPFIQDYIYRSGWQALRGVQNAAGEAIFGTEENVLLTASTASGKTEAAFFPILTLLDEDPPHSVGVLYIAPLKALINDQFGRLTELCEEAGIPVTRWHGDVPQTQKRRLLRKPRGILQITPESLESLLINKRMEIPSLFGDLRFVVIDEIHSLLRGDRGMQTFCLIERLSKDGGVPSQAGRPLRHHRRPRGRRALSGGGQRPGRPSSPSARAAREVWRLSMEHFFNTDPQADEGKPDRPERCPSWRSPPTPHRKAADPGIGYIFEHTRGKKCLIFSNSREECEAVCQSLRQYCEAEPRARPFPHPPREPFRLLPGERGGGDEGRRLAACPSAPPPRWSWALTSAGWSGRFRSTRPLPCPAFLQRMGRTGRRGDPVGDVVRHAGGPPGAAGHAAGYDSLAADSGHRAGAAVYGGALCGAAPDRTGCPTAFCTTRP